MSNRRRSSSFGIKAAGSSISTSTGADIATTQHRHRPPTLEALDATQQLWELVCLAMEDPRSKQTLLHSSRNICLIKALLDRAHQLDHYSRAYTTSTASSSKNTNNNTSAAAIMQSLHSSNWLSTMLRQGDGESGYTPLHRAVLQSDLPVILLLLRYSVALPTSNDTAANSGSAVPLHHNGNLMEEDPLSKRLMHRPLELLQGDFPTTTSDEVRAIFMSRDCEGLTAFQLMEKMQVNELKECRKSLLLTAPPGDTATAAVPNNNPNGRPRQNSLEAMLQRDHEAQQNEFADLHNYAVMQQQQQQLPVLDNNNNTEGNDTGISYACEVLAFGRSNHLALGVQGGKKNYEDKAAYSSSSSSADNATNTSTTTTSSTFRPHRVQEFAQDRVGRQGSAVAVAAAAHHTLVATRQGHLYAFGVGTGGRLGTGDNERHCPAPTRVLGPLQKRRVVAIAAAENHSLCVTSEGTVYAFGSNRFGQLGYSSSNTNNNSSAGAGVDNANDSGSRCCLPRRVDDLWKKHVLCVSVAAGEKHSVALSQKGEVYVWGSNVSGQLGINHRRSTSNSGVAHKVQRVDALWNKDKTRVCVQVAASAQSTLVLAKPSPGGLPVNQVYAWGHGNHVPSKVHFTDSNIDNNSNNRRNKENVFLAAGSGGRSINPVAIACARHHSAAITSDGRCYTWGFHADSLGGSNNNKAKANTPKAAKNSGSQPQLVTGMLPEEGGGFAVAVSASENHTAVVTSEGSLFTWGTSYGKDVMGHEGVRWQPSPKRVGGVCRAVGVSAAKEHTVLLMGVSFPSAATVATSSPTSLEQLAAQEVAKHVDLFNILPILMTAERINCQYLIEHCKEFVRLNIDGVLNVGQKSTMEMYLREQVASGLLLLDEEPRDRRERPLVLDIALATHEGREETLESETVLSKPVEWIHACQKLFKNDSLSSYLHRLRREAKSRPVLVANPKLLRRRSSSSVGSMSDVYGGSGRKPRSGSAVSESDMERKMSSSERCIMLTTSMDLSTRELVQTKYDVLAKETRGLKKRLGQIAKLEALDAHEDPETPTVLSADQREKIARRPQLESELCIFESALERVERRMLQFNLRPRKVSVGCLDEVKQTPTKGPEMDGEKLSLENKAATDGAREDAAPGVDAPSLRCTICNITCPDEKSFALHMNGRKHRNRVAQELEQEKKRTAAAMMEERHRQQMDEMNKGAGSRRPQTAVTAAWSAQKQPTKTVQSKYKLPSQSNPTQEVVEKQSPKPKSLHEIMEEEARKSTSQSFRAISSTTLGVSSSTFQLPPGSAPALKSPPWGGKASVKPATAARMPQSPNISRVSNSSPWLQSSPKAMPLQLPLGSAPKLKSPPWAAKPAKIPLTPNSPAIVSVVSPEQNKTPKVMSSFGDFLQQTPRPSPHSRAPVSSAPWSTPTAVAKKQCAGLIDRTASAKNDASTVSFQSIQKQEEDFKHVQDQSYRDNGKWFIERRERAGSLTAIQDAATKLKEEQLFIEEQKRIEAQIHRELALKKKLEKKKKRQQGKKDKQKTKGQEGDNKQQADKNEPSEKISKTSNPGGSKKAKKRGNQKQGTQKEPTTQGDSR